MKILKNTELKPYLQERLDWFLEDYQKNREPANLYRASLLAAADVNSPAVSPSGVCMSEEALKSNWSHRHLAYAAGLGTFGINNMLITGIGCCGRYDTLLSDAPIETGGPLQKEYCLYKKDRSCRVCLDNCFVGALTEGGFDRFKCYELLKKNDAVVGQEVCGKCTTGVPCAYAIP